MQRSFIFVSPVRAKRKKFECWMLGTSKCMMHMQKKGKRKQQIHGHIMLQYMDWWKNHTHTELKPESCSGLNWDYVLFTCEKKISVFSCCRNDFMIIIGMIVVFHAKKEHFANFKHFPNVLMWRNLETNEMSFISKTFTIHIF